MKENSIEEALEKLSTGKKIKLDKLLRTFKREGIENFVTTRKKYVDVILSDYKRVLKENETYKKQYFDLIDKIENKIDKFDYEFEKAKRKNDNDRANYYWDLIRNLKKILECEGK